MAYDEGLAERIRDALRDEQGVAEKRMFGGLCYMLGGYMMVGIVKDSLMARVGEAAEARALAKPGARPMDFTGKPMKGYVFVDLDAGGWLQTVEDFSMGHRELTYRSSDQR